MNMETFLISIVLQRTTYRIAREDLICPDRPRFFLLSCSLMVNDTRAFGISSSSYLASLERAG